MHAEFGLDLLDFFRGRYSWAKLERLLSRIVVLPQSHYRWAIADDDEAAERALEAEEKARREGSKPKPSPAPPLEAFSPEVQYLAMMVDRLGEVIQAVVSTVPKAKVPKMRPLPRPETALDRARRRKSLQRHHDLVAEVEEAQQRWEAAQG